MKEKFLDERRRAQDRAAELDIGKSNPPGHYPFVWDNRMGCVKRWYDYGAAETTVGIIYFAHVFDTAALASSQVKCATHVTSQGPADLKPVNNSTSHPDQDLLSISSFTNYLVKATS